jgi:hypothetical protein
MRYDITTMMFLFGICRMMRRSREGSIVGHMGSTRLALKLVRMVVLGF